jgi:ABC-type bacteriocin/lantibiotic exporter with double-glycine peptidase domain
MHAQAIFTHDVFILFSQQLYHRFYQQQWTDYLLQNSHETVRKIKHTPADFTNYVLHAYLTLISDLTICILTSAVLIWYDFKIVLIILLLSTPVLMFYYWFKKNVLLKINESFRQLTPLANIMITQGIDSFAETKIYHKENFFVSHFMTFNETSSKYLAQLKSSSHIPSRLFETLSILCFGAVIAYSKFHPAYQQNLLVMLGLLSLAMYRIVPSLNRILINISQIQAYKYSISELRDAFAPAASHPATEKRSEITFKKSIEFKDVSFSYNEDPSSPLLDHFNLTIHKGEFFVLEGPSGSGKTTLLHILAGLINKYQGNILIDNQVLSPETIKLWQNKIGFVPQAPVVLQGTILQNVAFGIEQDEINITQIERALRYAGLEEFINTLPLTLNSPVGESGLTISGGQRQRLILARALYRNPEVLLLDEVTSQLDHQNKHKILTALKELTHHGVTIILASHDPASAAFATKVYQF